jgi:hypothetical protein
MSIDSPLEQINNSSDELDNELFDDNITNSSDSNDEPYIYNNNFINENILLDVYSYLFNFMIQRRSDLIENNYNEEEIIKILKMYLITQSIPLNQINFVLFKFYQYYDIDNITHENIIEILENDRNTPSVYTHPLPQIIHYQLIEPQLNDAYTINYTHTQILDVINNLLHLTEPDNFQDVVVATDKTVLEKLNKYTLDSNLETKCVICMDNMNDTQVVCELGCKHLFHDECIKEHLSQYSYKCPICRDEVGAGVPLL